MDTGLIRNVQVRRSLGHLRRRSPEIFDVAWCLMVKGWSLDEIHQSMQIRRDPPTTQDVADMAKAAFAWVVADLAVTEVKARIQKERTR